MEVFIRTLKGKRLYKSLRVKFSRTKNFYKILTLTFSFLPALLVGNLLVGNNYPKSYNDKLIAFKHVATPVIVFFDGQRQEFITEKSNPEEALKEKGIKLDVADLTNPARESTLSGTKTEIRVKRARPVLIVDNGKEIEAKSAYDTVDEVLKNLGIKIYPEDKVSLEAPINKIDIEPKITIDRLNPCTISVDGQVISKKTRADRVKDLLASEKIVLGPRDIVDPSSEAFMARNMSVKVIRVNENTAIEQVDIPSEMEYVYDNNLPDSQEQLIQAGFPGRKEQIVNIVYQNGFEVDRVVIHETILSQPTKTIIKRGTRQSYSGTATWYGPGFVGSRTASGEPFNPTTLCAAHRTLPFGTLVRVTNVATGRSCVVRINDRGPYSYHIIDLTRAAADAIGMESVAPVILDVL